MKKIVALSIAMLPGFAFAQFNKGQVYVGGTLSTSLQNSNTTQPSPAANLSKNNSISAAPAVGVFLNPKIAIGGTIGYSYSLTEFDFQSFNQNTGTTVNSYQKYKTIGFSVGAFTRYYLPISNTVYFALHEQITFTRSNSETIQGNATQETTNQTPTYSIGVSVKPVLIFFPSPKWGIEAGVGSIGYSYTRTLPNVSSGNSFSLNAGSFSFGLAYFFARK